MSILALDVSGNFQEGKGTTGYCYFASHEKIILGEIKATDFESAEEYWEEHLDTIMFYLNADHVVIEGFRLYGHKSKEQTHSIFETPQLIGVIRHFCWMADRSLHIQYAHEVKNRWSEDVLVARGILEKKGNRYYHNGQPTNSHMRDALKHALHFERYGENK